MGQVAMERRLAAIMIADVVGYSRLMEQDEAATMAALAERRRAIFEPLLAKYHGRVIRLMGDGTLAEFASAVDAVQCAVDIQEAMKEANANASDDRMIVLRVGINLGDVVAADGDIYGDGVNVAARLEAIADPGGICLSASIYQQVERLLPFAFRDLGRKPLKNIARPVHVYSITVGDKAAGIRANHAWSVKTLYAAAAIALFVAVGTGAFWYLNGRTSRAPPQIAAIEPQSTPTIGNPSAASSFSPSDPAAMLVVPAPAARDSHPGPPMDQGIPVILVLPFEDLTADQIRSDLGRGIAEAFISDLSTFPDFEVVSSTTSFRLFEKTVPEIVKATGASFVVGGSVRRARDKVLVTVQLVRGSTDRNLKIAQLDVKMSDPVTLQRMIASRIRDELGGLTGALRSEYAKIAWAKADADLTEYDYYIRGHKYHLRFTLPDVQHGREIWEQGLARFPSSALLRCKLSFSYHWLGSHRGAEKDYETANRLVEEAGRLPKKSPLDEWQCHWAASRAFARRGDRKHAVAETRAALAMAPYDASLHAYGATVLLSSGLSNEAIEWAKFAVTHDANPPESYFDALLEAYRSAGRMQEAVLLAEAELRDNPSPSRWWYDFLAAAYTAIGQPKKAKDASRKFDSLPDPPAP